ncbi:serine carboxypeptidase S28-domain-containing protein [Dichomitus squalens]|nr:serine carboxypeptidase S28-domain-containing protein [Dichomitus squalens]
MLQRHDLACQTFKQQYILNATYFKEGGPILFYQSNEATTITCPDTLILADWAKEIGGLTATLEHRYFGQSLPFGNDSYTQENFKYLTLENVMQDAVNFIDFIKSNVTGASNSKAIVVGRSYGGTLSAIFRQNYPDVFYGAWAVSGPFYAFGDSTEIGQEVQQTYLRQSYTAFSRIKEAFSDVKSLVASGDEPTLAKELSLCQAPNVTDVADVVTFNYWLVGAYDILTQFSFMPSYFHNVSGPVLPVVINDTLSAPSPLAALNQTLWHAYGGDAVAVPSGKPCLDHTIALPSSINIAAVPFSWVRCNWVPLNNALDPRGIWQIGAPLPPSASDPSAGCKALWNVTTPPGAAIKAKYRIADADLRASTRIIFSVGELDPTTSVAQNGLGDAVGTDSDSAARVFVAGGGHGQDLEQYDPGADWQSVVDARNIELNIIKGWLNGTAAASTTVPSSSSADASSSATARATSA